MINCPKCDALIDVEEEDLDEGEALICEECGVHFVVASTDPLELEEDDDGDFDEDDEDFEEDEDEDDDDDEEEEDLEEEDDDWR